MLTNTNWSARARLDNAGGIRRLRRGAGGRALLRQPKGRMDGRIKSNANAKARRLKVRRILCPGCGQISISRTDLCPGCLGYGDNEKESFPDPARGYYRVTVGGKALSG